MGAEDRAKQQDMPRHSPSAVAYGGDTRILFDGET